MQDYLRTGVNSPDTNPRLLPPPRSSPSLRNGESPHPGAASRSFAFCLCEVNNRSVTKRRNPTFFTRLEGVSGLLPATVSSAVPRRPRSRRGAGQGRHFRGRLNAVRHALGRPGAKRRPRRLCRSGEKQERRKNCVAPAARRFRRRGRPTTRGAAAAEVARLVRPAVCANLRKIPAPGCARRGVS